jgi:hypothetical protein
MAIQSILSVLHEKAILTIITYYVIKRKYCGGNKLASIIVGHSGKSDLLFSGFGLA